MEVDVLNMEGEKVSTVELPSAIFEAKINVDLMHQAYTRQMANARLGTHSNKTRGEVRGAVVSPGPKKVQAGHDRVRRAHPIGWAVGEHML